jgi:hypothetical protein
LGCDRNLYTFRVVDLSDELPDELKLKMLRKLMQSQALKRDEKQTSQEDPEKVVYSKLSDDRALELVEKTKQLYPSEYRIVVEVLYELVKRGVVEKLDGLTVLAVLERLGLDVKPDLRIRFVKRGKEVGLDEYVE